MSLPAMSFGDRFCFSRKDRVGGGGGGVGWLHLKGADSSGLSFRNTLVGSGWVTAVLLCNMNGLKNSPLALHGTHFLQGNLFYPVYTSSCWLRALTTASLLMGGCGLSHKHVKDGCKSTSLV